MSCRSLSGKFPCGSSLQRLGCGSWDAFESTFALGVNSRVKHFFWSDMAHEAGPCAKHIGPLHLLSAWVLKFLARHHGQGTCQLAHLETHTQSSPANNLHSTTLFSFHPLAVTSLRRSRESPTSLDSRTPIWSHNPHARYRSSSLG
jgi:hypothetical protein